MDAANQIHTTTSQLTTNDYARVAAEWLDAWNAHDIDAIIRHYAPDVEFTSPFVSGITGRGSGTLTGKAELRDYFTRALAAYPDLHFKPFRVYPGVRSMVVEYESVGGRRAAEFFEFNETGLITRVHAHYCSPTV